MDFFQRQDQARRAARGLGLLFALTCLGAAVLTYLALQLALITGGAEDVFGLGWRALWNPGRFAAVAAGVGIIILAGVRIKARQMRQGGAAVAEMLAARPLAFGDADLKLKRLRGVVEEMAIASGVPAPEVYLLPDEHGVNAMAAGRLGLQDPDAALIVSQGCLDALSRAELQAVVGHAFSRILNNDLALGARLACYTYGLGAIAFLGGRLLGVAGLLGGGREAGLARRMPLPVAIPLALGLIAVGGISAFAGNALRAAVSRKRQRLADAEAVQFTRDPASLASALKKVGGLERRGLLSKDTPSEIAHMFFCEPLDRVFFAGLFAAHPRLEERVRALEPTWDGAWLGADGRPQAAAAVGGFRRPEPPRPGEDQEPPAPDPGTAETAFTAAALAGAMGPEGLSRAAGLLESLDQDLKDAARDPYSARAVVLALLLDENEQARERQMQAIASLGSDVARRAAALRPRLAGLSGDATEALAALSGQALRRLSPSQSQDFEAAAEACAAADERISLREWAVLRLLVDGAREAVRTGPEKAENLSGLRSQASVVLAALAWSADRDTEAAWRAGVDALGLENLSRPDAAPGRGEFRLAVDDLRRLDGAGKRKLVDACAAVVLRDREVASAEWELLRLVCKGLGVPLPARPA